MLQIYPTIQTVPDLRPTIFGFAVFHNLLVCIHLFFLGCIVSYLGLVERCVGKYQPLIYIQNQHDLTILRRLLELFVEHVAHLVLS